ncbi:MAG TPA: glutathione S-transferase family protein [Halothiobacillaceae bacterium]|nr:glutathione S-transferase family protein [Halothiobacillaceae bacterium]
MKLELISFKLCPFVQRSVATLLYKDVPFDTTFIDLSDPPAWFLELSPLGKVPILRVDDNVLFESAVINEFIDETFGEPMLATEPIARAVQRAWIEIGSACLMAMFGIFTAKEQSVHEEKKAELNKLLAHLERFLVRNTPAPYFSGKQLSLVDMAYGPIFQRLYQFKDTGIVDWEAVPTVARWADTLTNEPVLKQSLPEDFESMLPMAMKKADGYFGRELLQD